MPIKEQLRNATFRGVNFLVKDSRIQFGQKTVIHEYPNSDRIEVEYLGARAERFTLEMIIKGSGDQYFNDRRRLKRALLDPSNGTLLHPYEGQILCAVVGLPTLLESDKESGVATFLVDFIKVNNKLFPTNVSDNSGNIQTLRDSVQLSLASWIDETFDISFSENYTKAKEKLEQVANVYNGITNLTSVSTSKITGVKKTISDFNNNILSFLSGDNSLANGLVDLYNSLTGIGESPADQLRLWFDLFDSFLGVTPNYNVSTAIRTQETTNEDLINTSAQTLTLANLYNYTPELSFNTADEVDGYRDELENRYNTLDINDDDTRYNLKVLRAQNQKYLDTQTGIVGEAVTINNVQPTTLTDFVFSQYGNTDRYEQIKNLNNVQDPTNVSGNLQIITEQNG